MNRTLACFAFTAVAALVACGPGGGGMPDAATCPTAAQYPCAPYGSQVGNVIENLSVSGRRDDNKSGSAVDDPLRSIAMADYYADKNIKVLVVLVAAEWCQPCKTEQASLVTLWKSYQMATPGRVVFLEAIVEDASGNVAPIAVVDSWATTFKLPFDIAADPAPQALKPYYSKGTYPSQMVIRTSDMTIRWQNTGLAGGELKNRIDIELAGP